MTDALTGFDGKGLSISIRNGNVYVSMDDKLLFRSGSFEIAPNGARAVRDLAEVLAAVLRCIDVAGDGDPLDAGGHLGQIHHDLLVIAVAFATVDSQAVVSSPRITRVLLRDYLRQKYVTLSFSGIDAGYDAILPVIMRLPDVVATEAEAISEEEHAALLAAVEAAAAHLDAFREQEGAILIADLLRRVELIEQYKTEVVPFEKARTETVKARILDNLSKLAGDGDRNRLEQEMIFYLENLDSTEEKVRLTNHCNYFREVASSEEGAGRKLGFIAQEMGREINTMGSKANEPNIQILVVKMKDELEKIKEQVLNIL